MNRLLALSLLAGCASISAELDDREEILNHASMVEEQAAWDSQRARDWTPIRSPGDAPDVTVYAYWPFWGDPLDTLPWDQLTDVAIFDVQLNSDGSIGSTHHWTTHGPTAVALAAPYDVSVHLSVTAFSDSIMNSVLPSASKRTRAINELADMVNSVGADGVAVDFEGMDTSNKQHLVAFVEELKTRVDEVTVATPAVDWNGAYDYDALALGSDGVFIMGYDYRWGGGNPGPIAPLFPSTKWGAYSLEWTVDDYTTWGTPEESIILGLPLYGRGWGTTSTAVPGTSTGNSWTETIESASAKGDLYGRHYDIDSDTAYALLGNNQQLWYDDVESLETKISWALDRGLQGIGFWAISYEDNDPEFWEMIDDLTHTNSSSGGGGAQPASNTVCYPGEDEQYTVCTELVASSAVGYNYPSPLSSNYQAPTNYVDLATLDGSTKVAPNFALSELAQEWKGQHAVLQVHAVEQLQALRDEHGPITITSGFREPGYNAGVGGATWSRHMYGDAFDMRASWASLWSVADSCRDQGAGYVATYTNHVHCDWRWDAQEPQFYSSSLPPVAQPNAGQHASLYQVGSVLSADAVGFDCGEPTREWYALDAAGNVIADGMGAEFEPPAGAVRVEVVVGSVEHIGYDL